MSGDILRDSAGREITSGARVTYHGTLAALHGEWAITGPCACQECLAQHEMTGEHHLVLSSPASGHPLAHVSQASVTLASPPPAPEPEPEVTQLWQALPGDVISVPGQYPPQVTVLSLDAAGPGGHFLTLSWASPAGNGRRQLTRETRITLVSRPSAAETPPQGTRPGPGAGRAAPRPRGQAGDRSPRPGAAP